MLIFYILFISSTTAFYKIPTYMLNNETINVVVPTTNHELQYALCSKYKSGYCIDEDLRIIMITKTFNFTGTEGNTTEEGCYHLSTPECLIHGQMQLNQSNQCAGLEKVNVTYDNAGPNPLLVGSNKYILSSEGGLIGKGLKINNNNNVFICGLAITDINPHLIWGGDAITIDNATNIWIHGNYFSRIGRQMIVTGYGPCQNVVISHNEFDGRTPYSAYCDGLHYWLWLFEGYNDTITLYRNVVHDTSGRGPHLTGMPNTKALVHMIKNLFINVQHRGLVQAASNTARVLIEGNIFINVSLIVSMDKGSIYYPFTKGWAALCKQYIGRKCYLNEVENSGGLDFESDVSVLEELKNYSLISTSKIDEYFQNFYSFSDPEGLLLKSYKKHKKHF